MAAAKKATPKVVSVQPANDKYSSFYVFLDNGEVRRWSPSDKPGENLEAVGWTVFDDE